MKKAFVTLCAFLLALTLAYATPASQTNVRYLNASYEAEPFFNIPVPMPIIMDAD